MRSVADRHLLTRSAQLCSLGCSFYTRFLPATSRRPALAAATPEQLDHLIELVAKGELRGPVVDRQLPLEQAAEAHRLIEERQTFGKVVLKP